MKANYLVCYDIADERRLNRVYKYLRERGLHIQYSVFHCQLTWKELQELKAALSSLINGKEDDVRIYPLPQDTEVFVLGCGDRIPNGVMIFLR